MGPLIEAFDTQRRSKTETFTNGAKLNEIRRSEMITLNVFGVVMLAIAIISIVINILQLQKQLQVKKEKFRPIYNGLIGLFNDVNNKVSYCYYEKRNHLLATDNAYNSAETLKQNFNEFISESISYLNTFREHIVPILKTMDSDEERIFKAADFGITDEQRESKRKANEKWQLQQEIEGIRLAKELEQLKSKAVKIKRSL